MFYHGQLVPGWWQIHFDWLKRPYWWVIIDYLKFLVWNGPPKAPPKTWKSKYFFRICKNHHYFALFLYYLCPFAYKNSFEPFQLHLLAQNWGQNSFLNFSAIFSEYWNLSLKRIELRHFSTDWAQIFRKDAVGDSKKSMYSDF